MRILLLMMVLAHSLVRGGELRLLAYIPTNEVPAKAVSLKKPVRKLVKIDPVVVMAKEKEERAISLRPLLPDMINDSRSSAFELRPQEPHVFLLDDVDVLMEKGANHRTGEDTYLYEWKRSQNERLVFGPGGKAFYPLTESGGIRDGYALTFTVRFKFRR